MKKALVFFLFSLLALSALAQVTIQPKAKRIYWSNSQLFVADSATGAVQGSFTAGQDGIMIYAYGSSLVAVQIGKGTDFYRPTQILTSSGTTYGSSVSAVVGALTATRKDKRAQVRRTVVLLGDSEQFLTGGPISTSGASYSLVNISPQGVYSWAAFLSGQRTELVNNAGLNGDVTANMLRRFDTDVSPYNPDIVSFWGGINNVSTITGATNMTTVIANTKADILAICNKVDSIGATMIIHTLTPVAYDFQTNWLSTYKKQAISEINTYIRKLARTKKSVVLADIYTAYANPAKDSEPWYTTDGSGYPTFLIDGLHQAATGAYLCGKLEAAAIASVVPPGNLLEYGAGTANKLDNPSLTITAGASLSALGGSTTNVGSWLTYNIGSGSPISATSVAATDVYGTWLQFTFSANTILSMFQFVYGLTPGDSYKLSFETELDASSTVGVGSVRGYIQAKNVSAVQLSSINALGDDNMSSGGNSRIVDSRVKLGTGVVETPPITLPANTNFLQVGVYIYGNSGAVLRIRKMTLIKVS